MSSRRQPRVARGQPGQALVVFAIMLVGLLGTVAVGVDLAYAYAQKRAVQSAADLAALSGAMDLPDSTSAAKTRAIEFAQRNGYAGGSSTTVAAVSPYASSDRKIEVTITHQSPTFFARVLGRDTFLVRGRAVARRQSDQYLIFAGKSSCDPNAIQWSGPNTALGPVHSNSGISFTSNDNVVTGEVTYNSGCSFTNSGNNNTFAGGVNQSDFKPYPMTVNAPSDFQNPATGQCTYTFNGNFNLNQPGNWWAGSDPNSSTQLKPGTYCAIGGNLTLSRQGVSSTADTASPPFCNSPGGGVTFYATGTIWITGDGYNLKPCRVVDGYPLLAYSPASGPDAIKIAANGGQFQGTIFAPDGEANLSGLNNAAVTGSVFGNTVKLLANGTTFQLDPAVKPELQLVE